LFGILRLFNEWKEECGGFSKQFITQYTFEDLQWLVFGVAAVAGLYLDENGKKIMHQGRSGTDVCEHFFAHIRQGNPNPTAAQARDGASLVSGRIGMSGNAFRPQGRNNAAEAPDLTVSELMEPIPRN
jgi:hypothetical protein